MNVKLVHFIKGSPFSVGLKRNNFLLKSNQKLRKVADSGSANAFTVRGGKSDISFFVASAAVVPLPRDVVITDAPIFCR